MSSQTAPEDPTPGGSLKALAMRAASWTIAGRFTDQGLRLVSNVIVARLLFPEAFGLMAIVGVFLYGLQMFSDLGVGPSIIHHSRGEEDRFLDTAWTIQVIRGAIITLGAWAIAWPVSQIYGEPELTGLLGATGCIGVIQGFSSTAMHTQQRKLMLGRVVQLELISQVVRFVVMLVWAWLSPSVWALVGGSLAAASSRSVLSHFYLPHRRHRLRWDRESARSVFHFGSWIFLSSIFTFIGVQGDRMLLGYYLGTSLLGVYYVATRFTEALTGLQGKLTRSVFFPVFAETFRSEPARLVKRYYKVRLYMDLLFLSVSGVLCTAGHLLIDLLYDARYAEAGWILQVLAIQVSMTVILTPPYELLVSVGKTVYGFARSVAKALWILIGIPVAFHFAGLEGVVWCVALSELPVLIVVWSGLRKQELLRLPLELRSFAIWAASAAIGWLIELALRSAVS